jgi:hypothetical protein
MLITTLNEIRQFIPIDQNLNIQSIEPSIAEAEELYIKPVLGAYYPILTDAYATSMGTGEDEEPDADAMALLPLVQRSLAYYALYLSVENLGSNVGDMGIQQQNGRDSMPAPRWKVQALQMKYLTSADRFADNFLAYLEDQATTEKYSEWYTDSTANTSISGYIVHSTRIASKYIDINESRRIFLRLKKRIREVERTEVKRLICTDQYEEILEQLANTGEGELSEANRALLDKLEPYIAKRALYLTIPSLAISLTHEGLTLYSSNDSVVSKAVATGKEKEDYMKALRLAEWSGYEADEEELRKFIADNINDYPLIEASPCWTARPDPAPRYKPDNDISNKHFSV